MQKTRLEATDPSNADHDVARMQVSVHKVVGQQHLEVCVHSQGHYLGVEGARLPDILGNTLACRNQKLVSPTFCTTAAARHALRSLLMSEFFPITMYAWSQAFNNI